MARVALSYVMAAVLLGAGVPTLAAAQSSKKIVPHPATVVRYGGTRAGMAPPPPETDQERLRSRTTEGALGFDGEGVGVVVGSFARPDGRRFPRRECADLNSLPSSRPLAQPTVSQPVVTQPGYGSEPARPAVRSDDSDCRFRDR